MIRAVLFDVDGVLLDSFEANLKFVQDLARHVGYPAPTREMYSRMFHLHLRAVVEKLTKATPEEVERICDIAMRDVPYDNSLVGVHGGVLETLPLLQGYVLGIVTSRTSERVEEIPHISKLHELFSVVVTYEDTKRHKPYPDPLLLAAEKLGVEPGNCVYVGDQKTDLEAAHAAGMRAIIFSTDYKNESFAAADAKIDDFRKIPELILDLNK